MSDNLNDEKKIFFNLNGDEKEQLRKYEKKGKEVIRDNFEGCEK